MKKRLAWGIVVCGVPWAAFLIWLFNFSPTATRPVQAQPATIRAHVAPLKTAVRQLKSGKWRLTLETTDSAVGRLQKGQSVEVRVR